ncbi:Uncharacterized protein Fot_51881 [Forsythia ovata]|uniref:Uncharacterized protein n=1 Tax=Forsythia ovata TaxID=205694 RepID=A0ABD1Q0Q2_9LAMI
MLLLEKVVAVKFGSWGCGDSGGQRLPCMLEGAGGCGVAWSGKDALVMIAVVAVAVAGFSAMKIFDRFSKILMRVIFSLRSSRASGGVPVAAMRRSCDRPDPPKTSCSSYYSSSSHYNEAIADCIEFFNKSSQDGVLLSERKSEVML